MMKKMENKIIYLLGQNDIPKLTSISGNIDLDTLKPFIKMAQDCNLKTILGENLYNKIETDFMNDELEDEYLDIYNKYIVDMLVYYSTYYLFKLHNFKVGNKGIMLASPDNFETIELSDIEKVANTYNQLGASVELRFQQNKSKYNIPELRVNPPNQSGNYKMNWWLK